MPCFCPFFKPFGIPCGGTAVVAAATVGAAFCAPAPALAAPSAFRVTVQTGGLQGLGTFGLDFLLQNGAATNPLQATIRNFRITGGNLIGTGGPTAQSLPTVGNLGSSLFLSTIDGGDVSEFAQDFRITQPGSQITFDLTVSSNAVQASSSDPDFFSFFIVDGIGTPLTTNAPQDNTSLVFAAFDRARPQAQGFSSAFPAVSAQATPAPEPSSAALLLSTGSAVTGAVWRLKKRRASRFAVK